MLPILGKHKGIVASFEAILATVSQPELRIVLRQLPQDQLKQIIVFTIMLGLVVNVVSDLLNFEGAATTLITLTLMCLGVLLMILYEWLRPGSRYID